MTKERLLLARGAENEAAAFLEKNGYKVISANYRTEFGEIDLVARDKEVICFVEVKSRRSSRQFSPEEAIGRPKQRRISRVALNFLKENNLLNEKCRFDVVTVAYSDGVRQFKLLKAAFDVEGVYAI